MLNNMQLLAERKSLFENCLKVGTPDDLLAIEEEIAHSIRRCERALKGGKNNKSLQFHIERLRLYADGFVWRLLHPHTIRQLAENRGPPVSIKDQGEAFDEVLKSAQHYLQKYKVPILVADITNVIRIGDLVLCTNPEVPQIVECKTTLPPPELFMQGRFGRQISRMMGTLKYLSKGSAKVFGDNQHRLAIESPHTSKYNWQPVSMVCDTAMKDGRAFLQLSAYEFLWAYNQQGEDSIWAEIHEYGNRITQAFFGTSLGLMNMSDGLFPPPTVWPIPPTLRFLLMEKDIVLAHMIDAAAFECDLGGGQRIEVCPTEDFPIRVIIEEKEYPLSRHFINDVLYGFETIASCVQGLIEFARELHEMAPVNTNNVLPGKPRIHYLESIEDAHELAASKAVNNEKDFVVMTFELFEQLKNNTVQSERSPLDIAKKDIVRKQAYPTMSLDMLKKLMRNE